ncbi:GNAT family N-acetyltransferase [Thalassotalea mangrovi]|uniref:GNAT family N-acetyltransferase n=1 Tax=Thalassotalea mangrovi TaxID=2572245 RepID=A0A4U1B8A5_9GAMM|nr:GNAT family N-acetyltransferase [Thalassotalea mangrovi]TKB46902.1 GNAT family N-acetyltransferase [Thalassotalea mangrovi]
MLDRKIHYLELDKTHFDAVIALGNHVHGDGYLDQDKMAEWVAKGIKNGINSNFVAMDEDKLVGFRICYSPGQWQADQWCSPDMWKSEQEQTAYFKCNTVDATYRGYGIGSKLLKLASKALQNQGATAGVSHLWRQSPGNSAVKYFTKCGGILIQNHPDKWHQDSIEGYDCPVCSGECHCVAAEMIIYF